MTPTRSKTTKNSKRGGRGVQTVAKKRGRKSALNISDADEATTEAKMDGMLTKAMNNPMEFKLCLKADADKLESSVQTFFNNDGPDDVDNDDDGDDGDSDSDYDDNDGRDNDDNESDEDISTLKPRLKHTSPEVKTMSKSMQNLDISSKETKSRESVTSCTPLRVTRQSILKSEKCLTPRGRNLRDRKEINYCDTKDDLLFKPKSQSQKRNETQEPNENEVSETPKKKKMTRMSVRQPLNSVDENQDYKSPVRESPKSQQKKSTKGKKNIDKTDSDEEYTPNKRKNDLLTMWRETGTRSQTSSPVRKKLLMDKKDVKGTPKSRAATPKNRVATPKCQVESPKSRVMTPKARRNLTPSMHMRNVNVSKPKTNLQEFRTRLHVSFVPKSLPCRETEFNDIFTFLKGKLTEEIGGCIYISGVPGTGKTATVNEVIKCLKKLESKGDLEAFEFIDINGMKLTEPRQAYVQIKKKITGTASSWEESHRYLHDRFTTPAPRRNMILLLIDEMDLLCTKRQDVVYNLLDWPTHKSSHLVVITIANTMDLPERVLMGRVSSRLGLTRLTFSPYNHIQLMEIVKTRLKDMEGFKPEAIQLVARKVASVSGDARRALDICRRATEIAESNNREFVTILDVTSALSEMIANPRVQAIQCCSRMERLFMEAISQEVARTGIEQVTLKDVYVQFDAVCILEGEEVPNITQTLEICRKLASWRLILWESGADLYQSVLLNVTNDDIYFSKKKVS